VRALAAAKEAGFRVSGEVSPHHLLLTDEDVRALDTNFKMHPPLAGASDRDALVDGLRRGAIDCIATDHAPHARDEKEVPFEQAPMGTTGLETAFAALHTELVLPGVLELDLVLLRMTAGAELFGLPAPLIAPGEPANVTVIDLDGEWTAGEPGWHSRAANSCFAGRRLRGQVLLTVSEGMLAHRDDRLAASGRAPALAGA
jgi:dihydroorotase